MPGGFFKNLKMKKTIITVLLGLSCMFIHAQDTTLNHIYHPGRLNVLVADTVITGTITRVTKEIDGDLHVVLDHGIEAEFICQCDASKVPDAQTACIGYNIKFPRVRVGDNITVEGPFVNDMHHRWNEIHPVRKLTINHAGSL